MLVNGVWRLWLTPRRNSSLAASSSRSCEFWASTCANSCAFRIATAISLANSSRRSWSARSQRGSRAGGRRGRPVVSADAQVGPDRRGSPGTSSVGLARIDEIDRGSRSSRRPTWHRPRSASQASGPSRGEALSIAARILPSSRLRRSRSAARRLWLSARRATSSSPATRIGVDRSPAERDRRPRRSPAAGGQVRGEEVGDQDAEEGAEDDREQQSRPSGNPSDADRVDDEHEEPEPAAEDGDPDGAVVRRARNDTVGPTLRLSAIDGSVDGVRPSASPPMAAGSGRGRRAPASPLGGHRRRRRASASTVRRPADEAVTDAANGLEVGGLVGIDSTFWRSRRIVTHTYDGSASSVSAQPRASSVSVVTVCPRLRPGRTGVATRWGQLDSPPPTVASRRWSSSVRFGPRTRLWRGTLSPSRRSIRLIRARSSG